MEKASRVTINPRMRGVYHPAVGSVPCLICHALLSLAPVTPLLIYLDMPLINNYICLQCFLCATRRPGLPTIGTLEESLNSPSFSSGRSERLVDGRREYLVPARVADIYPDGCIASAD